MQPSAAVYCRHSLTLRQTFSFAHTRVGARSNLKTGLRDIPFEKWHRGCRSLSVAQPLQLHAQYWNLQNETRAQRGYWKATDNQRKELKRIGEKLGVRELSDWYGICRKQVEVWGGGTLFTYYPSLEDALRTIYPEYPWKRSKFGKTGRITRSFLKEKANQRHLLTEIGQQLQIKQLSDWHTVDTKEFLRHGGWRLLKIHSSLEKMLRVLYPDHPWEDKFGLLKDTTRVSPGHWNDNNNLLREMDKAETKLGLTTAEDWFSVTLSDLREVGFPSSLSKAGLVRLLQEKYPLHRWEKVLSGKYSQQRRFERAVRSLFPGIEMKTNVRKEAQLVNPKTGEYLELDIWFPSLKFALEYQERHHYVTSGYAYEPVSAYKDRDRIKQELARANGIDLLIVPCWWDGSTGSLAASIRNIRTDLLAPVSDSPIPEEQPEHFFEKQVEHINGIGQPTLARFFTLSNVNPVNWWVFEKFDGVRGFWNPLEKVMYSRTGKRISLPDPVINALPSDIFLDGELWFGRDNFQEALKMVTTASTEGVDWSRFKYIVFDVPQDVGSYEQRYSMLVDHFAHNPCTCIEVADRTPCRDTSHLEQFFQTIIDQGGEGIILRDPSSPYQPGRTSGYLKHKKYRDGEAQIVDKVTNQLWECELPSGIRFFAHAATTEFVRRWNPQKGDIVSFKHKGYLLASKKPKTPSLYRLRSDLAWEDVVANWKENKPAPLISSSLRVRAGTKQYRPKGYWKDPTNLRSFFCNLAAELGFDALNPTNWTSVQVKEVLARQGHSILANHEYSLKEALRRAFPEFEVTTLKDKRTSKGFWQSPANCRRFFEAFAKEKGFDPLQPSNWYSHDLNEMNTIKGGFRLARLNGGWKRALQFAFPELEFTHWLALRPLVNKWKDSRKCREYFTSVAHSKGFDPLDPQEWYKLNLTALLKTKEGLYIREQQGGMKKALKAAFPEITFSAWER